MPAPAPHDALPAGYSLRTMAESDHPAVSEICRIVYPTERPYTEEELAAHQALYPEGQFVAVHDATGAVAGAHFTLVVRMLDFHLDDPWDVLTAGGTFRDHDPVHGHTLYGADLMVHPGHQHHGLARALTLATRGLVQEKRLWRMVGGSRMPGYGKLAGQVQPDDYIARVKAGQATDPVLTAHLHDGWDVVTAIRGYLPHDEESAGWAAVIQWVNEDCPPPFGLDLSRVPRRPA